MPPPNINIDEDLEDLPPILKEDRAARLERQKEMALTGKVGKISRRED